MTPPTDVNDTIVYNGADLYLPKDSSVTVFEDSRLFLFGEIYLNGQPVLAGPSAPSGIEVYVGPTPPVDPGILLWWDINEGTYGSLKAHVGGNWKLTDDPQKWIDVDEVYVGPVDPIALNYQIWVDTTAGVIKAKSGGAWVSFPGPTGATGPTGPPGATGASGIIMSPNPPPTTAVLWADTDEEGSGSSGGEGSGGGISAVFANLTTFFGVSGAPNTVTTITFTDSGQGTSTTLPSGWIYSPDGKKVMVPPGVYSFHLAWNAPDQYWYGKILGAYQLGSTNLVEFNPGATILTNTTWYGAVSGTATLQNDAGTIGPGLGGFPPSAWFYATLTHAPAASATNSVKWALNVTRLGDIPT